jgi:cyclohexanecarboxyl-CoA dehydrogenase
MFCFSEEQESFRESVRRFGREKLRDGYLTRAKSEAFPLDAYRALAEAGLLGLGLPAELGGAGADHVTMGIAVEEVARADFNLGMYEFYGVTMPETLRSLADPAERQDWCRAFVRGERLACGAFTEPAGGSDLKALKVRAVRDGDGWRLSGEKTSVTIGPHAHAASVLATTDPTLGTRFSTDTWGTRTKCRSHRC